MQVIMSFDPNFTRQQVQNTLTPMIGVEIGAASDVVLYTKPNNTEMDATIDTSLDEVRKVQILNFANLAAVSTFLTALPNAASDNLLEAIIKRDPT